MKMSIHTVTTKNNLLLRTSCLKSTVCSAHRSTNMHATNKSSISHPLPQAEERRFRGPARVAKRRQNGTLSETVGRCGWIWPQRCTGTSRCFLCSSGRSKKKKKKRLTKKEERHMLRTWTNHWANSTEVAHNKERERRKEDERRAFALGRNFLLCQLYIAAYVPSFKIVITFHFLTMSHKRTRLGGD